MRFEVYIHPQVIKFLRRLPKREVERIKSKISDLTNPHSVKAVKVKGKTDTFRLRVGDYRILYTIDQSKKLVVVFKVDKRERIYDRL